VPKGIYERGGIYWARFRVRGHRISRFSLRTRSIVVAERRLKAERQRDGGHRLFRRARSRVFGKRRSFPGRLRGRSSGSSRAPEPATRTSLVGCAPKLDGKEGPRNRQRAPEGDSQRLAQQAGRHQRDDPARHDGNIVRPRPLRRRRLDRGKPGAHDGQEPLQGSARPRSSCPGRRVWRWFSRRRPASSTWASSRSRLECARKKWPA
jgi:hypothetical protein